MNATVSTGVASQCESPFNAYLFIGPVVLGALVNASLFGSLVIQTYVYYANFANDHRAIKFLVSTLAREIRTESTDDEHRRVLRSQ